MCVLCVGVALPALGLTQEEEIGGVPREIGVGAAKSGLVGAWKIDILFSEAFEDVPDIVHAGKWGWV